MKSLKVRNLILLLLVCSMASSCGTLQQPLPGSLWGNWTFVRTGTITDSGHEDLRDYRNVCYKESDRIHFSSDNKMTLRWYDESCMINYYLIGRYHVEGNTLKIDLAKSRPHQDSPFPPITEFRIIQINETTLKLEEISNEYTRNRGRLGSNSEAMVFVFMKLD